MELSRNGLLWISEGSLCRLLLNFRKSSIMNIYVR